MSFFLKKHLSSTDSEVKDPFLSFGFFFLIILPCWFTKSYMLTPGLLSTVYENSHHY